MSLYDSPYCKSRPKGDLNFQELIMNYLFLGVGIDSESVKKSDDYGIYISLPETNEMIDEYWQDIAFITGDLNKDSTDISSYPFGVLPYDPIKLAKAFKRDYHNLISRSLDVDVSEVESTYPVKMRIRKEDWTPDNYVKTLEEVKERFFKYDFTKHKRD